MTEIATTTVLIKNSSYVLAFFWGFEYLGFEAESMTILIILMILDICTAIARVWLNEGGRQIKSSILKKGVAAKILLITGLFAVAISSKALGFEVQHFAQGVVSVLILGELYSVLGNIHSARTGAPKVEFDAVAYMLARVKEMISNVIK